MERLKGDRGPDPRSNLGAIFRRHPLSLGETLQMESAREKPVIYGGTEKCRTHELQRGT